MNPAEEHPLNALTEQATEEERKKQIYTQESLRTLEGDIQEAIQERNASTASMVMAEQAKYSSSSSSEQKQRPSNYKKKSLIIFASIFLVALGVGGAYYLYLQSPLAPSAPAVPKLAPIPGIVPPDAQKIIDVTGLGRGAARTAIGNALLNIGNGNGSILQIIPVEKGSAGAKNLVNASGFISLLGLPAPDVLSRSLNNQWMLGTYNDNGTAMPFIILTDSFFQNAYAGMIAWEKTMPDDFVNIFGYANKATEKFSTDTPVSFTATSSTSTTSAPVTIPAYASSLSSYFNIQGGFKDGVIDNKDVRTFTKPDGTMLVLYSFVDNNTIVITTDENALVEIINRLEKQTFIR
jgi:hypothetical protein